MAGEWRPIPTGQAGKDFWANRVAKEGANAYGRMGVARGPDPNVRVKPNPTNTVDPNVPDPGKGSVYAPPPGQTQTPPPNPYGTESGPGILESWFNMRAAGTDPAFDYASKRGMEKLGNQYSAAGAYNSGAARQGESDLMANLISQRMGQLDSLAGGASGEHQNRLDSMFNQGLGIAGGRAGLSSAYDLGAANNMTDSFQQQLIMELNKAGVDSKAAQGIISNIMSGIGLAKSGGGKGPYG